MSSVAVIRGKKGVLYNPFLLQFILSPYGQKIINAEISGQAITRLTLKRIASLVIPIPPLELQKEIARILTAWDDAIALTEKLITAKRRLKQGIAKQLFTGHLRFERFVKSQQRHKTTLGNLPKDWTTKKFSDIAKIDPESLGANTSPNYSFKYIDLGCVKEGSLQTPSKEIEFSEAPSRARKIVKRFDVLMSTVRTYLNGFTFITDDIENLVCSTGFSVIRATSETDARYIYEFLFSHLFAQQVQARLVGSNYPAINSGDVKALHIPWSNANEQEQIGEFLSTIGTEIQILEKQIELLKVQKQGLMQQLLTGKIRIQTP